MRLPEAPVEGSPLNLFHRHKLFTERRDDIGNFSFPPLKGKPNGLSHIFLREFELSGKQPDVVEILHPAVQFAEFYHRFKFLCDGTFAAVAKQLWGRRAQQGRQFGLFRFWENNIPKTDIDLHMDPCRIQCPQKINPDALIVRIFSDALSLNRAWIKDKPVSLHSDRDDIANQCGDGSLFVACSAEKIDVHSRSQFR